MPTVTRLEPRLNPRLAVWVLTLWAGVIALAIGLLMWKGAGLPSVARDATSFHPPEVRTGVTVSQRFRVEAPGFSSVAVGFEPNPDTRRDASVTLALWQLDYDGSESLAVRRELGVTDLSPDGWLRLEFPPIRQSAGRDYRLDVSMPGAEPGTGLRLWAAEGRHTGGGTLLVNGTDGFAELVFTTGATPATLWGRLRAHLAAPAWPIAPLWLLAIGALAAALALALVTMAIGALAAAPDGPRAGGLVGL